MSKFAIRLLTLGIYATALLAVPMVTPAKAAADGSREMRKHRKNHRTVRIEEPRPSNQAPHSNNPYDDPDRKVSY